MIPELTTFLQSSDLPLVPLLDALPYGVVIADAMGVICFWNTGAAAQFGFSKDEVVGNNLMMLMPDRFVPMHVEAIRKRRHGEVEGAASTIIGNTVEIFGRRKDGSEFPIELSVISHSIDGTPCYLGIICDVTDQKMMVLAKLLSQNLAMMNEKLAAQAKVTVPPSILRYSLDKIGKTPVQDQIKNE